MPQNILEVRFRALTGGRIIRTPHALAQRIRQFQRDHAEQVRDVLREYPPPPPRPNVRYVRTGTLGRSWHVVTRENPSQLVTEITNNATDPRGRSYAQYVHGNTDPRRPQQDIHEETQWASVHDERVLQRAAYQRGLQRIIASHVQDLPSREQE